jgi:hypothetical protein
VLSRTSQRPSVRTVQNCAGTSLKLMVALCCAGSCTFVNPCSASCGTGSGAGWRGTVMYSCGISVAPLRDTVLRFNFPCLLFVPSLSWKTIMFNQEVNSGTHRIAPPPRRRAYGCVIADSNVDRHATHSRICVSDGTSGSGGGELAAHAHAEFGHLEVGVGEVGLAAAAPARHHSNAFEVAP